MLLGRNDELGAVHRIDGNECGFRTGAVVFCGVDSRRCGSRGRGAGYSERGCFKVHSKAMARQNQVYYFDLIKTLALRRRGKCYAIGTSTATFMPYSPSDSTRPSREQNSIAEAFYFEGKIIEGRWGITGGPTETYNSHSEQNASGQSEGKPWAAAAWVVSTCGAAITCTTKIQER